MILVDKVKDKFIAYPYTIQAGENIKPVTDNHLCVFAYPDKASLAISRILNEIFDAAGIMLDMETLNDGKEQEEARTENTSGRKRARNGNC